MIPAPLTAQEETEISLIASDASELARAAVGVRAHPDAGVFPFATTGMAGLVTEESFRYLSQKSPVSALHLPKPSSFSAFARNITKARARLKLFDDSDGGAEALVDALSVSRKKTSEWFNAPHRGFLRTWVKNLQPDLGMYFVDENVIATTDTALLTLGTTREELDLLTPSTLDGLGKRLHEFGFQTGRYLRELSNLFERFGKSIDLTPQPLAPEAVHITRNDFAAAKAYRVIGKAFDLSEDRQLGAVIMALSQINCAAHVLPSVIDPESNLLFRMRFLTAYHSLNLLRVAAPQLYAELPTPSISEAALLTSRDVRNSCAHYGLRGSGRAAVGSSEPFTALIENQAQVSRTKAATIIDQQLRSASETLRKRVSKSGLRSVRALFGEHS